MFDFLSRLFSKPTTGILTSIPETIQPVYHPWNIVSPSTEREIKEEDYLSASKTLNVEVEVIKSVTKIESNGKCYLPDGKQIALFEAHVFHRLTNGRFANIKDRYGVALSVKNWDRSLYGTSGQHQLDRIEDAAKLDKNAAVSAASWGAFQILGSNFKACGYSSAYDFALAMGTDSDRQLDAFINFIKSNGLDDELRRKDWQNFARLYNGPNYQQNAYHIKMANEYNRLKHTTS